MDRNLLPSWLFVSRRGMEIPSLHCRICDISIDSVKHLLFSCTFALEFQKRILRWWEIDIHSLFCYEDWLSLLSALRISSLQRLFVKAVFVVSWWHIWNFRNKYLSHNFVPKRSMVFDSIVLNSFRWCQSRHKSKIS